MTKPTLAVLVLLAAAGAALPAQADDEDWAGMYAAIDDVDGSYNHLSIVPLGGGTFDVRMTTAKLAYCAEGTKPGWIVGKGRLVEGRLLREQSVVRCEGSDEPQTSDDQIYRRDRKTGILTQETVGGRVLYYHRLGED